MQESIREITIEQFLEERNRIGNVNHQALFDLLFLTGFRISEVVRVLKKRDIDLTNIRASVRTLKNKKETHRQVSFLPRAGDFSSVIESFSVYISRLDPETIVWDFSRQTAWKYCKKYFDCTDHSFRHSNAIIASRDYRLPPENLRVRYGWSKIQSAEPYLKYQTDAHTEKLIEERGREIYGI